MTNPLSPLRRLERVVRGQAEGLIEKPDARVECMLDLPAAGRPVPRGRVEVAGWAVDAHGPLRWVGVGLDGAGMVTAEVGELRPDVARVRPELPGALRSGWRASLDLTDHAGDVVVIGVLGQSTTGELLSLGRHAFALGGPPTTLMGANLDTPLPGSLVERGPVAIRGWAITTPQPVARVEVSVGGGPPERARLAVVRADLEGGYPALESGMCGFEHIVDLDELPVGATTAGIGATVVALDGTTFDLGPFDIRVVSPSAQPGDHEGRLAQLRARVDRFLPSGPSAAADAVRLVAFTHRLDPGGGQLYLTELLRQLADRPDLSCTVVANGDGPLRRDLEEWGVPVHVTGPFPVDSVEQYEGRLAELAAWLTPQDFNVAMVNTLGCFPGADLAGRLGIPYVWAVHESFPLPVYWHVAYPADEAPVAAVEERGRAAVAGASAVIFEADATRRLFESVATPERLVTVPYGIDLAGIDRYVEGFDRTAARRRLGLSPDAPVVLCMGTIEPRKSQTLLAQAWRELAPRHPDAQLVFVGDFGGSMAAVLKRYLAGADLGGSTRVMPVVADTYEWYGIADLLVSSSDVESLPRSGLEAMAFGLPVVAAEVFGLPELISDGRTGWLFEPRDLEALIRAVDTALVAGRRARAAVAAEARRLVRARHDSSNYASSYQRLLWGLVRRPDALPASLLADGAAGS